MEFFKYCYHHGQTWLVIPQFEVKTVSYPSFCLAISVEIHSLIFSLFLSMVLQHDHFLVTRMLSSVAIRLAVLLLSYSLLLSCISPSTSSECYTCLSCNFMSLLEH